MDNLTVSSKRGRACELKDMRRRIYLINDSWMDVARALYSQLNVTLDALVNTQVHLINDNRIEEDRTLFLAEDYTALLKVQSWRKI